MQRCPSRFHTNFYSAEDYASLRYTRKVDFAKLCIYVCCFSRSLAIQGLDANCSCHVLYLLWLSGFRTKVRQIQQYDTRRPFASQSFGLIMLLYCLTQVILPLCGLSFSTL